MNDLPEKLTIRIGAGRLDCAHETATKPPGDAAGSLAFETVSLAQLEQTLQLRTRASLRLIFSPGAIQCVTRSYSDLPGSRSDQSLFLDRTLQREFGETILQRRIGRAISPAAVPPSGANASVGSSDLDRRRTGRRSAPAAGSDPRRVLVTDILAEAGLPTRVLQLSLASGCDRIDAEIDSPPSTQAVTGPVLAFLVEPSRAVLCIHEPGRAPYAVRSVAVSGSEDRGSPATIEREVHEALVTASRELLSRAHSCGVSASALVWRSPGSAEAVVLPSMQRLGAALRLPVYRAEPLGSQQAPLSHSLRRPPGFFPRMLGRWRRESHRLHRLLPVALLVAMLLQVGMVTRARSEIEASSSHMKMLAAVPLPGASPTALPSEEEVRNRARELSNLTQDRNRSLYSTLSALEPLIPDAVRLSAVELKREDQVSISGRARDSAALTLLFSRLQTAPGFTGVFLLSESRAQEPGPPSRTVTSFTLQGRLAALSKVPAPDLQGPVAAARTIPPSKGRAADKEYGLADRRVPIEP